MTEYPASGLFEPLPGGAYKARNAIVTGDVSLGEDVGVWFGCVLRGDDAPLIVGRRTNIQDLTMVHADHGVSNVIGEECTIGHRCVLHGAKVGDRCLIGMGAILLGGCEIGAGSIIAAGAVVKENAIIPPRSLVVGVPGKVVKTLDETVEQNVLESVEGYVQKIRRYL